MQFIDRIKRDAFEKSIKMNLIDFQFNDSEEEKNTESFSKIGNLRLVIE